VNLTAKTLQKRSSEGIPHQELSKQLWLVYFVYSLFVVVFVAGVVVFVVAEMLYNSGKSIHLHGMYRKSFYCMNYNDKS
tara:strand:- start:91 stop:327 length:237 start_codon:yes stop_codon:yes gene_type:complete